MIKLTQFAERHFRADTVGTKILDWTPYSFEIELNRLSHTMVDGSYEFSKLLIVPNFTDAKPGTIPITKELREKNCIRTGYAARTDSELPVLGTFAELHEDDVPKAKYLVIVLYHKKQLEKEGCFELSDDYEYGIVAILGQMTNTIEPMKPITMFRNQLGTKYGGNGADINNDEYMKSVEFWSNNISVKII